MGVVTTEPFLTSYCHGKSMSSPLTHPHSAADELHCFPNPFLNEAADCSCRELNTAADSHRGFVKATEGL